MQLGLPVVNSKSFRFSLTEYCLFLLVMKDLSEAVSMSIMLALFDS